MSPEQLKAVEAKYAAYRESHPDMDPHEVLKEEFREAVLKRFDGPEMEK